ncbi:MAG: hypothetical protein U1E22_02050, partial [Coriobacteriia bacterium]|nr:hypothetical protein [Coriobacteriia bacterium]
RQQLEDARLAKRREEESARRERERASVDEMLATDMDTVVSRALACLHSMNRRAKHLRDDRRSTDAIYQKKDAFLDALLRANRATLEVFQVDSTSLKMRCEECGHTWVGSDECLACGGNGYSTEPGVRSWYVVDCGSGYRFHRPTVAPDLARHAIQIETHNPTQPRREIPQIGLSDWQQMHLVEGATERLRKSITNW